MKSICAVYRSRRNPDTYLYVDHHEGLSRVPEALQRELGGTERAMTLVLTPQRRLARTSAAEVLRAIRRTGLLSADAAIAGDAAGAGQGRDMMNASDYALAWSLYLLACAVVAVHACGA